MRPKYTKCYEKVNESHSFCECALRGFFNMENHGMTLGQEADQSCSIGKCFPK